MAFDVVKEANQIRNALDKLGWQYLGGGPYPFNPTMTFYRAGDVIKVTIAQEKGK